MPIATYTSPTSSDASLVEVSVLGGLAFVVDHHDVPSQAFARRDSARLAGLLALTPRRRLHREQVFDLLWPDAPLESAANRLHKAAHFIRRATGRADSLVLSNETVALFPHAEVRIDAVEFERRAAESLTGGNLHEMLRAIALYRGDVLPYDLYEDWAEPHRVRLQGKLRELLRAAQLFDRLLEVDPTDEAAHIGVMRALLEAGDRSGVIRQFEQLTEVLEQELGVRPGAAACSLRDRAIAMPTSMPRSTPLLHGRRFRGASPSRHPRMASGRRLLPSHLAGPSVADCGRYR